MLEALLIAAAVQCRQHVDEALGAFEGFTNLPLTAQIAARRDGPKIRDKDGVAASVPGIPSATPQFHNRWGLAQSPLLGTVKARGQECRTPSPSCTKNGRLYWRRRLDCKQPHQQSNGRKPTP